MPAADVKKLNRQKPFAEIYGELVNGGKYEQDGAMFDAEGKQVRDLADVERELDLDAKAKAEAHEREINAEVERRIAAMSKEKQK